MKNLSFLYVVFFLLLLTIIGLIYSRKFLSKIIINKNFKVVNGNELMSPIGESDSCVRDENKYSKVRFFLLFIGYARSGSTLVGSILDAHPNVVISNEYGIIEKFRDFDGMQKTKHFIFDQLFKSSRAEAIHGQRAVSHQGLFNYHVPNQWQGRYNCSIKIIGDKKGVGASRSLLQERKRVSFEELKKIVNVPIKFIHVYRNPYDNVATMVLRSNDQRYQASQSEYKPYLNMNGLWNKIRQFLKWVKNVEALRQRYPEDIFDIDYSQLLNRPKRILKKMCKFLDLHCSKDYLENCSRKMFRDETKTRYKIVWSEKAKHFLTERLKTLAPYRKFTFGPETELRQNNHI